MTVLPVVVDSVLRLDPRLLDEESLTMIYSALTVVNPEDPAEVIGLGWEEDGMCVMPRGFALRLRYGLAGRGYEVQWVDRRATSPAASLPDGPPDWIDDRAYQRRVVDRMEAAEQVLVEAPPSAGKTFMAGLHVIRSRQRTCVLVDKVNIATQWIGEMESLGIHATFVGDGIWDDSGDVVLALRQSLWSRRADLGTDWFAQFGELHIDEAHQISSTTLREIVNCFPAKNRFGHSATLERREWMEAITRIMIGEVGVRVSATEMAAEGVLVQPRVLVIRTGFEFDWNKRANANREYYRFTNALLEDRKRNNLIGRLLVKMRGRCVLVSTDRIAHAEEIRAQALATGWPLDSVMLLIGKVERERRVEILERAEQGDCVIISTIGKEAINIPRLSAYMIAWPTKSVAMTIQMLGRVRRMHASKELEPPIVVDLFDNVGPGINHFRERRGVYEREGLQTNIVDSDADFVI